MLANSRIEVRNTGNTRFEARVGVDDSTRNTRDKVRFAVYGDGKLLAETPPMGLGEAPRLLAADIGGMRLVEIVARSETRASDLPLVVAWGDAALRR